MRRPFGLKWYEVAIVIVLILVAAIAALVLLGPQISSNPGGPMIPSSAPTSRP